MCSRYSLTSPPEAVRHLFGCADVDAFPPRYNIAPTEPVIIARRNREGATGLDLVRWGLIPGWAKDPKQFTTLINARSETAAEKPAFRGALRHRRCLVPTTGFYEWSGARGAKQPHLVRVADRDLFALAGIWEGWLGADGSEIETMAILTTAANRDLEHIHDRMPVIVDPQDFDRWLDCSPGSSVPIEDILRPLPEGRLSIAAVSRKINKAGIEGPELQQSLPF